MPDAKILTETTNINNLTEQPAILEHVARLNDEIASIRADRDTFKEELDAAWKSRDNLRKYAAGEAPWDTPMSTPETAVRDEIRRLRAKLHEANSPVVDERNTDWD